MVLAGGETESRIPEIAKFYRAELPNAHVPARILTAHELPKGATGKVDRQAVQQILLRGD